VISRGAIELSLFLVLAPDRGVVQSRGACDIAADSAHAKFAEALGKNRKGGWK